jgi:hypothetical protein
MKVLFPIAAVIAVTSLLACNTNKSSTAVVAHDTASPAAVQYDTVTVYNEHGEPIGDTLIRRQ